jgi:hypothetical protein
VRPNKTNIDFLGCKDNNGDQSIIVSFYIEHKAVISNAIDASKRLFNIGKASPLAFRRSFIPVSERDVRIGIQLDKLLNTFECYDSHLQLMLAQRYGLSFELQNLFLFFRKK